MNQLNHIAFICDGNATWAKNNSKDEFEGYTAGFYSVIDTIKNVKELGVPYSTYYLFSTENWNRPDNWRKKFFELAYKLFDEIFLDFVKNNNVKVKLMGDISMFDTDMQELLSNIVIQTKNNTATTVHLAVSYGGRDEIVRAVRQLKEDGVDVTEESLGRALDTYPATDPDVIVRTKNMYRLSNFMLWQASYSEFIFVECMWPEFNKQQLSNVIDEYKTRKRTFGRK